MTRQVQNPLTCASPSDEVSEVAASSQRRDTALQRTASSLNLYKIIGDSSSEIVWEQASAPNADCIFSGDPRFACANKCLTVEEAYETVHPDDQPLLRSDIDSLHSGEQDSFSRRIRALGCDGSWIPVDVCARSLRDNNRTPLYLIGGFKGISNLPPGSSAIASSRHIRHYLGTFRFRGRLRHFRRCGTLPRPSAPPLQERGGPCLPASPQ